MLLMFAMAARACFKCLFSCVSETYVAKEDLDVAYIAMAIHGCFKSIFQMFHLFLVVRCKCFIFMFQK